MTTSSHQPAALSRHHLQHAHHRQRAAPGAVASSTHLPPSAQWTLVGDHQWVARWGSEYAGTVETDGDGVYTAYDRKGMRLDVCYRLDEAMLCLDPDNAARIHRGQVRERVFMWIATGTALLAGISGVVASVVR